MSVRTIYPAKQLKGEITVPGDKSISHRAVMLGSIALGTTEINNFLGGADCLSTIQCFRDMGVEIEQKNSCIMVHGRGLRGLTPPAGTLDTGKQWHHHAAVVRHPGRPVISHHLIRGRFLEFPPYEADHGSTGTMGAQIKSMNGNDCAPLSIQPGSLHGISYVSPVASAQVKSAILLAGPVRGRGNLCKGACPVPESYRTHASEFRRLM